MIKAVLDHLGVPHEDGFFAKDIDVSTYSRRAGSRRHGTNSTASFRRPPLLFYINHLAWEVTKSEDVFAPAT